MDLLKERNKGFGDDEESELDTWFDWFQIFQNRLNIKNKNIFI